MLNDAIVEMITRVCDEEMFTITEKIISNYGRRGAIFVAIPSRAMMFATRKEVGLYEGIYQHSDDMRLLMHLITRYNIYTEAVLVFVSESSRELIKIVKVKLDTVKLHNTFAREN